MPGNGTAKKNWMSSIPVGIFSYRSSYLNSFLFRISFVVSMVWNVPCPSVIPWVTACPCFPGQSQVGLTCLGPSPSAAVPGLSQGTGDSFGLASSGLVQGVVVVAPPAILSVIVLVEAESCHCCASAGGEGTRCPGKSEFSRRIGCGFILEVKDFLT